jgi:hypothetical protein
MIRLINLVWFSVDFFQFPLFFWIGDSGWEEFK